VSDGDAGPPRDETSSTTMTTCCTPAGPMPTAAG
jgi:hypothetical protein